MFKSKKEREFFLADRSLSGWTVAGSILLTNISTVQFIGLNGSAYQWGVIFIAWEVIAVFGMIVCAKMFLPHYYSSGVATIPEFVGLRYGKKGRLALAILVCLSTGFIYLPTLVYSSSVIFADVFRIQFLLDLPPGSRFFFMAVFLVLIGNTYILFGGMRFIARSDTAVAIIFGLFGLSLTIGCALKVGDGNLAVFFRTFTETNGERLNPFGDPDSTIPWTTLLTGLLLINVQVWCTAQGILQRALAARSLPEAQKGVLLAALGKLIIPFIVIIPGMIAYTVFKDGVERPDSIVLVMSEFLFPRWGIWIIGIISFLLFVTSFNSNMHALSTLFINDVLSYIIKKTKLQGTPLYATSGAIISLIIICIVPNLYQLDDAFFIHMKRNEAFFNITILFIVVNCVMPKSVSPRGLFYAILAAALLYFPMVFFLPALGVNLNWLHALSLTFAILYIVSVTCFKQERHPYPYSLEPTWKSINPVSVIMSGIAVLWYGGLWGLSVI